MPTSEFIMNETDFTSERLLEMLIRTTHQLHSQFETHLSASNMPSYLTGPRLRFLLQVEEAGQIHMHEIAAKLGIKPRTVTQFVDAMEQEQLILRIPDPKDRRATYIRLTEHAPELLRLAKITMKEAAEYVLGSLPAERRKQLYELLVTMMR